MEGGGTMIGRPTTESRATESLTTESLSGRVRRLFDEHETLRIEVALLLVSLVAAVSLARCFTGPGELFVAVAAVVVAQATVITATILAPRHRLAAFVVAGCGVALVGLLPIWLVCGGATKIGIPTFTTGHVVGGDLSQAWSAFNIFRAPVPELPGFAIVCGWATGGAALLAGWAAAGGDTPLWVAAPPTAVFVFTAALGTPQWRGAAIAAEVIALGWYAVVARAARRTRGVYIARVEAHPAPATVVHRPTRMIAGRSAAGLIVSAAVFSALVGPRLPGAVDAALLSLRNSSSLNGGKSSPGSSGSTNGPTAVNPLVAFASQEILQSKVDLFTVQSPVESYLIATTLDQFDGDTWTTSSYDQTTPVFALPDATGIHGTEQLPGDTSEQFVATVNVQELGGDQVPSIPNAIAVTPPAGSGSVLLNNSSDELHSPSGLSTGMVFSIQSVVTETDPDNKPLGLSNAPINIAQDLQKPSGIPAYLTQLAHQIVTSAHATTPYEKALALQQYFQLGGFTYSLPKNISGDQVTTGAQGLQDIVQFLKKVRSGFCQQYATAYGLLARIDGLPTRVAVGYQMGPEIRPDVYEVTGTQAHAWPQVWLGPSVGWWSFEPTPGADLPRAPVSPALSGTKPPTKGGAGSGKGTHPVVNNNHFRKGPTGATNPNTPAAAHHPARSGSATGTSIPWFWLVLAFAVLVFAAFAPTARFYRRRRYTDPSSRILNAWADAANALALVGIHQWRSETFTEVASRARSTGVLPPNESDDLVRLARATTVATYASVVPAADVADRAVAASGRVVSAARKSAKPVARILATFDPRESYTPSGSAPNRLGE